MNKSEYQCVLGFDFGMKSIGVAVAQSVTGTAAPLNAIPAQNGIPHWDSLDSLYKEWQPDAIVVGALSTWTVRLNILTFAARKFANRLQQRFKHQVHTHDERLTTVEAKQRLFDLGGYKKLEERKN